MSPLELLRHHVTGAIERGEAQAVQEISADKAETLYLDYFNNFLSLAHFAEFHGMSEKTAEYVIIQGRKINHSR
jgi:hypothetical protein